MVPDDSVDTVYLSHIEMLLQRILVGDNGTMIMSKRSRHIDELLTI